MNSFKIKVLFFKERTFIKANLVAVLWSSKITSWHRWKPNGTGWRFCKFTPIHWRCSGSHSSTFTGHRPRHKTAPLKPGVSNPAPCWSWTLQNSGHPWLDFWANTIVHCHVPTGGGYASTLTWVTTLLRIQISWISSTAERLSHAARLFCNHHQGKSG